MPLTIVKKLELSFANKAFIIFIFLLICNISYFTIKSGTSSTIGSFVSSLTSSSDELNGIRCHLAMKESDNWFCESDADWKRRRMIHHMQDKRNRVSDFRSLFFQNNWEPTIQCEFERRIGNAGDGGKWVCDIHRFGTNDTKILVYSLGSNGDFSFEQAVKKEFPNAEIHTFDMGLYQCPLNVCTFHQLRLGDGKNGTSKTLQMIINDLGHQKRTIHILKVDIEGSEFDLFENFFQLGTNTKSDLQYIRQILFEIHLGPDRSDAPCRRAHQLFELFRSNNYAIFHKEANLYDAQNVFEYALLRLNQAFFIPSSVSL